MRLMHRSWSELVVCPDCAQRTLRVFLIQREHDDAPVRTDEFCDNPACTRGDQAGIPIGRNA
jgi:hypothetical protein